MIVEIEREEDGRWIAEIPDLPGVMVYGATREEAVSKVEALARIATHTGLAPGRPSSARLGGLSFAPGLQPGDSGSPIRNQRA